MGHFLDLLETRSVERSLVAA